jgi:hypothetical protein
VKDNVGVGDNFSDQPGVKRKIFSLSVNFFLHFPCRISIARSWPIPVVLFPNIDTTAASAALMFSPTLLRCCGQKVL